MRKMIHVPDSNAPQSIRTGLVLTALGPDRPGLVHQLSTIVEKAGANFEDARMAKLGGEFAVLVFATGDDDQLRHLEAQVPMIEEQLNVVCFTKRTSAEKPNTSGIGYLLEVSGSDRPGIVKSISDLLSRHQINVATFISRVTHAPWTGTPVFLLDMELQVPAHVQLSLLRKELSDACEEENLDFQLKSSR